jgi:serine/threonine protein kinase/tetratricopeptide (TPR) repeat protein
MINHRYSVIKKLGEDGAGEVFLVEDTLRGNQPLALKALWPAGHPGAVDETEFLSEVALLLQFIHPNVIRIFDSGLVRRADDAGLANRRYYTMEFVEGTDSYEWCMQIPDPNRKSTLLESLLAQSLSVLSYIHHDGVIHFDIKPQSLMLVVPASDADFPVVKLTDFGFSKQGEEEGELPLRGTLEYAAPELLRGEPADYRIDLYSLGATFFHLLEGRCPFEASDPAELINLVLTVEPRFVQGENPRFARLRSIISLLMQKDPTNRFPSARAAGQALLQGKPDLWRYHFGFSARPKFVGRKQEREVVARSIDALRNVDKSSKASAIVVRGEEGIGKSALLREMTRLGRSKGLAVYELTTTRPAVPFNAIELLLAMLQAHVKSASGEGEKLVGRYASVLSLAPGWLQEKDAVIESRTRFITDCALTSPFLAIADDLHRMDMFSLQVLQGVTQNASAGRFLLLAAEPRTSGQNLQSPRAVQLPLGELTKEELREMGRALFGAGSLGDAVGSKIFDMFGGVPEIAVEAFRTVAERVAEEAAQDESAAQNFVETIDEHLPVSLDEMVIRRIEKLDPGRQSILSMLSCFTNPVRVDLLPSLVSLSRDCVADHLAVLELDGYIERVSRDDRVLIRARRLKTALLGSLGAGASALHRQIARTLENVEGLASFEDLEELGFQFGEIGVQEKASHYFETAADEAMKLLAFQRAAQLYATALGGVDTTRRVGVTSKLAESYFLAGEYQQAVDTGSGLLQEGAPPTEVQGSNDETRARLLKAVGRAQSELGDYDAAKRNMTTALGYVHNESEQAELLQELVGLDISLGDYVEAEKSCRSQIARAKTMDNRRLMAAAFTDLGMAEFYQGKFDDAVASFNESMNAYTSMNQLTRLVGVMTNLGNVMSAKGDMQMAVEEWTGALRTAREFGTLNQQARILNNLGIAHYNLKVYDKAKEFYGQARQLFERTNSKSGLGYTLTNFGEVYLAEGEYENALDCWTDARELYIALDDLHGLTETYLQLAQVYAIVGDLESTTKALTEAERLIGEKKLDLFFGQLEFMKGRCRMAEGSWSNAADSLSAAVAFFEDAGLAEKRWSSQVNIARCHYEEGGSSKAVEILENVLGSEEACRFPMVMAESFYLLGDLATTAPNLVEDKPLNYYKKGMEVLEKEAVTELTWKMAFALARECHERGQAARAREYLTKVNAVLEYFLNNFSSDELRDQYLFVDQKNRVLSTIEILMKT